MNKTRLFKTCLLTLLLASCLAYSGYTRFAVQEKKTQLTIGNVKVDVPTAQASLPLDDPLEAWSEASYIVWAYNSTHYACRNMSTNLVESLSTNESAVFISAVASLPQGGTIFVRNGAHTFDTTVAVSQGISIIGEGWGDDNVLCTKIIRTANVPMFTVTGDHVTIKNLFLAGDSSQTAVFINMTVDSRFHEFECLTFYNGTCKGIDLSLCYWVTVAHIRPMFLADYAIYCGTTGRTMYSITDVIGYHANGLVYLYGVKTADISGIATDYFVGISQHLIYLESCIASIKHCDFEGNTTLGMVMDCIRQIGGRLAYSNLEFQYCGDSTTSCACIEISDTAYASFDTLDFLSTLGWRDVYCQPTCTLDIGKNVVFSLGPQYLWTNTGSEGSCINGTAIAHGLAGTPTTVLLTMYGQNYINSTCWYLTPTLHSMNSTHFVICFAIFNAGTITGVASPNSRTIYWQADYVP